MKSEDNWVPWESTFFLFYFHFLKFQIRHPPNQNSFREAADSTLLKIHFM